MKNKNILYSLIALLFVFVGCVDQDKLTPSSEAIAISSVSASFVEGDYTYDINSDYIFKDDIGENLEKIDFVIRVPWFFPEESEYETDITKMQLRGILASGCDISPGFSIHDLTQKNIFTLTDQYGNKKQISVTGERYKLPYCQIEEIKITDNVSGDVLSGIINHTKNTINIGALDPLTDVTISSYTLSPHATASISTNKWENIDLEKEPKLTVTAHDGSTKVYSLIRNIPTKLERGLRPGSAKIMFEMKLADDLGITTVNMTGGIAATKDYVVINTRNENSIYIDAKTGKKLGEINLGEVKGSLINFYSTADNSGNILINNITDENNQWVGKRAFRVWKLSSISSTPELFIDWPESGSTAIGRKLSIQGSLDGDAIITAPYHNVGNQFARWIVTNGVLKSHIPETITIKDYTWSGDHIDVIYTSNKDINSDYFAIGYSSNQLARINGQSNTVSAQLDFVNKNFVCNTLDYINFNNTGYVAYNYINGQPWGYGQADQVWLIDADGNFSGNPSNVAFWHSPEGKYGSGPSFNIQNTNTTGDVALRASEDGFYLYLYFMFTNGYIVGVQFDCIDM